ncbi:conserved hypothetical protein [Histoplasma capsulatum G186AR]|uniref:Uncharacterized protein n=1 Tax=Ajellomyces capsulatus (strain G186AR / H82 / ATCC MYA-2454 / RMSCC 2432) TaxID=447093 RepID=C0NQT0_AJECG|nr:uncharacterized protein HCBG_05360 [Histoplasma capsulatum G186AR]EEH06044.1 conserved hypothetical protein [Histoplasma capsulatum G186AR]
MSSSSTPITPQAFAEALKSLPLSSLYAKVSELRNSIAHLQRSNDELARYIAESSPDNHDQDCEDAIRENEVVIVRMQERIDLLKVEVEERGQRWSEEMDMDMVMDVDDEDVRTRTGRDDAGFGVGATGTGFTGTGVRMNPHTTDVNGDAGTMAGTPAQAPGSENSAPPAASVGRTADRGQVQGGEGGEGGIYL